MPSLTKERIQEMLREDLVVNDTVFKILTTCSGIRVDQFAPKKGIWGEAMGKGTTVAAKATFQVQFAALTSGFEAVFGANARAKSFLRELRAVRQLLFTYAARYQEVFVGEYGPHISQAITASINQDFEDVAKGIGDVAAAIKSAFPNGPPMLGQVVPELPLPVFPRTRSATDRITGVQQQVLLQSVVGATNKRSVEGGGSLGKRKGTVAGGALQPRQPAQATQSLGSTTLRMRDLEASGCPRGTCIHYWKNEGCLQGRLCRFKHDMQAANGSSRGGVGHRAVSVLGGGSEAGAVLEEKAEEEEEGVEVEGGGGAPSGVSFGPSTYGGWFGWSW
eukprot:jgi/Undpi1/12781/HiC_scaffold_6.g02449.m1